MRLAALFSGGKDSAYALYKAREEKNEEENKEKDKEENSVSCLVSLISSNPASYMFHTPNIHLVSLQARAMRIPIIKKKTPGKKEEELEELEQALEQAVQEFQVEGVVTGAVASNYQRKRVLRTCEKLGLECFNPLWGVDQLELLEGIVNAGFQVMVTGIFAYPLTPDWLGRMMDEEMIEELAGLEEEYSLNPAGEGGEIETTVLDAPFFHQRIEVRDYQIKGKGNSAWMRISDVVLVEK